jgi:Toprim domain
MMGKVRGATVMARKPDSEAAAASRKRDLSADDIANLIQPVALELLGTPNQRLSSQSELRFGSNGSLAVTIAGDRIGQWYSFEEGCGGGVLDLIVRERGGSRAMAVTWLKTRPYCNAGHPLRAPTGTSDGRQRAPVREEREAAGATETPPASAQPPAKVPAHPKAPTTEPGSTPLQAVAVPMPAGMGQATYPEDTSGPCPKGTGSDRKNEALEIWRNAWPIEGTPAAVYLRWRGIDPLKLMRLDLPGSWPETLRYSTAHPGIALIVAVHDARTGLVCAIQRIFLTREGQAVRKSGVYPNVAPEADKKIKRSLGPIRGNAARFSCWPDPAGRWGIAEGPETALAAQQLLGFPVWSAISSGNMAKIDPPYWASQAFVVADHDDGGMEAAAATATRLSKMPSIRRVQIIRAVANKADVADVLKESAR